MTRRVAAITTCCAVLTLLLATVATADRVALADGPPTLDWDLPRAEPIELPSAEAGTLSDDTDQTRGDPIEIPDVVWLVTKLLLAAAGVALALHLWSSRPRLTWRRPPPPDDFDPLDEVASAIAADAAAARASLREGDARNAIVACWVRLETLIAEAGVEPAASDTAEELAVRVLLRFSLDDDAVTRLAALYREARFSTHPLGEEQRAAAVDALDAIHRQLEPAS